MSGAAKCECGGELKPATLAKYDFESFAGVPVWLVNVPGLQCSKCASETLDGEVVNDALARVVIAIVRRPVSLSSAHARCLRRRMHLTQRGLAERMAIARETVADWERGAKPISAQHNFILRALALASLHRAPPTVIKDVLQRVGRAHSATPAATALVIDFPRTRGHAHARLPF